MSERVRAAAANDHAVALSTWKLKPGREGELDRVAEQILAAAERTEGHLAGTVLHEPGSREFQVVHRFTDERALTRWMGSPERRSVHPAIEEIADREGKIQHLTGLEGWFQESGAGTATMRPPPRWKMWMASLAGAYPLVVLFQWLVVPELSSLPLLLRAAVFPLVILTVMTYAMMPFVTRVLHRWLYPDEPPRPAPPPSPAPPSR